MITELKELVSQLSNLDPLTLCLITTIIIPIVMLAILYAVIKFDLITPKGREGPEIQNQVNNYMNGFSNQEFVTKSDLQGAVEEAMSRYANREKDD